MLVVFMLLKKSHMVSFIITLAAGATNSFMDRLYMCLKMANIAYDHIVYKGSKLIHGKSVQVLYDFLSVLLYNHIDCMRN